MRAILPLLGALALGGCVTTSGQVESIKPICDALIGPIKYNSAHLASLRHAGPALAPDLKKRNQVGRKLGCPAYR